jgi:arylsulfatase A-like enzyme
MPHDNATLAWELKNGKRADGRAMQDEDWRAATFHTGTLSEKSGLLRGFDQRLEAMVGHDLVTLDSTWSVFRSDLLLFVFRNKLTQRFDNAIVASSAREWLAQHAHERFMTMVHLYSTHTPYDPPAWARALYCDPAYKGPIQSFYSDYRELIEQGKYAPTAADVRQIRDLYCGGVSHADQMIGSLVDELRAQGVLDDTLVIVTADHGESLGEEQGKTHLWEHDHIVQTNLRIPLVVRYPKAFPAGKRIAARTEEIDVFPTVLELAQLAAPQAAGEFDKIDGSSLLPLVRGEGQSLRPFSFAENALFGAVQDDRWKLIVDVQKIQGKEGTFDTRLFDLSADPGELHNLAAEKPGEVERLFEPLRKWSASMPHREMEHSARDRDQEELIKRFGYTGEDKKPK